MPIGAGDWAVPAACRYCLFLLRCAVIVLRVCRPQPSWPSMTLGMGRGCGCVQLLWTAKPYQRTADESGRSRAT